jgi:[ribosomal protein S5]-alanine N-acetyltransferase
MEELFKTNRLKIRELVINDFDAYFKMHSNPTVMNVIPAAIQSYEEARIDLNKRIKENSEINSKVFIYAIELLESSTFIGLCGIIGKGISREIGYRLDEPFWKQGFGSELVEGLIQYIFQNKEIQEITADVTSTNNASIALLNKYMIKTHDSFNKKDNCIDFHYKVRR